MNPKINIRWNVGLLTFAFLFLFCRPQNGVPSPSRHPSQNHPSAEGTASVKTFNVKSYGARGDGQRDDTKALQAAIDAAVAAGGGDVVFAPGTYKISRFLVLDNAHAIKLTTESSATIRQIKHKSYCFIIMNGSSEITITNLILAGSDTPLEAGGLGGGILIGNYYGEGGDAGTTKRNIVIENVQISGFAFAGILLHACQSGKIVPRNEHITIRNSAIRDCQNGIMVYKNGRHIKIENNIIEETWQDGIAIDTRCATDPEPSMENADISIRGNVIRRAGKDAQAVGILVKGKNNAIDIAGNRIHDIGVDLTGPDHKSYGILLGPDSFGDFNADDVRITGNSLFRISSVSGDDMGIFIGEKSRNIRIEGNWLYRTGNVGLRLFKARDVKIRNNVICSNWYRSLLSEGSDDVSEDNILECKAWMARLVVWLFDRPRTFRF
jgi:polygalacturonase